MILVLYDGSNLLKSSGGSFGMGSPQYAHVVDSGSLGMPHVSQLTWLLSSFLFTGLGLKHMVVSFPSHVRYRRFAVYSLSKRTTSHSLKIIRTPCIFHPNIFQDFYFWLDCNRRSNTGQAPSETRPRSGFRCTGTYWRVRRSARAGRRLAHRVEAFLRWEENPGSLPTLGSHSSFHAKNRNGSS
jgi:hypothetical protein